MKRIAAILLVLLATIMASARGKVHSPLAPVRIWEGTPERAAGVLLYPFPAEVQGSGTCIIVCPGGSYFWHDMEAEGESVARWLSSKGITAFVLKYRVGGVGDFITGSRAISRRRRHPDMIADLQMAVMTVRTRAGEFGIDPSRIGVMGFSAGGHLAMSSAVFPHEGFLRAKGVDITASPAPDFVAPVYPVVTFSDERYAHRRSRRGLLGEGRTRNRALRDSLSLEKHIPAGCPPVFLLNCKDDPVVRWENSALLDSALTEKGVPHLWTLYETGGHGFGADITKQDSNTSGWQDLFLDWLGSVLER